MRVRERLLTLLAVVIAVGVSTQPRMGMGTAYAQAKGMGAPPSKVVFSTAPTKFGPYGGAKSLRHAIWCDIHPEVKGEIYVIKTRGETGG